MKVIYKYHLIGNTDRIMMPRAATPLSVAWQDEQITLWALVDTDFHTVSHKLLVLDTGQPFPKEAYPRTFIGTVHNPPKVHHVFYLGERA